jgi:3-phenylpropionate/cinnamic acid dioxygenase small subunit
LTTGGVSVSVESRVLHAIDTLQIAYVRALDDKDLAGWLRCFNADGSYICRPRENEERSLPIALMLDDTYERLEDRVKMIDEVWRGTFEDYATRHFVQRLDCVPGDGAGTYRVRSNVLVMYSSDNGTSQVLVTGTYLDEVVLDDAGATFRSKKALIDSPVTPRYLVYPV